MNEYEDYTLKKLKQIKSLIYKNKKYFKESDWNELNKSYNAIEENIEVLHFATLLAAKCPQNKEK